MSEHLASRNMVRASSEEEAFQILISDGKTPPPEDPLPEPSPEPLRSPPICHRMTLLWTNPQLLQGEGRALLVEDHHSNGVLKIRVQVKPAETQGYVCHGTITSWYENGLLAMEGQFHAGYMVGKWVVRQMDGTIQESEWTLEDAIRGSESQHRICGLCDGNARVRSLFNQNDICCPACRGSGRLDADTEIGSCIHCDGKGFHDKDRGKIRCSACSGVGRHALRRAAP